MKSAAHIMHKGCIGAYVCHHTCAEWPFSVKLCIWTALCIAKTLSLPWYLVSKFLTPLSLCNCVKWSPSCMVYRALMKTLNEKHACLLSDFLSIHHMACQPNKPRVQISFDMGMGRIRKLWYDCRLHLQNHAQTLHAVLSYLEFCLGRTLPIGLTFDLHSYYVESRALRLMLHNSF